MFNMDKLQKEELEKILLRVLDFPLTIQDVQGSEYRLGQDKSGDPVNIILHEPFSFKVMMKKGISMYLGELYMNGDADVKGKNRPIQRLVACAYRFLSCLQQSKHWQKLLDLGEHWTHLHPHSHSKKENQADIHAHYDISNDFYRLWLDETLTYSCAYFETEHEDLTSAQKQKVTHILKKLDPKPGKTLVDIGCGWGTLMLEACEKYDLSVTGITLSQEQYQYVQAEIQHRHLEDRAQVLLEDYRNLEGQHYDYVVSVGMFEHVGKKELPNYFRIVKSLLHDDGIALIHGITGQHGGGTDPWLDKYIFPGGYIPSLTEILTYTEENYLQLYDLETLRRHYQKTLELWTNRFEAQKSAILAMKDEQFYRMWDAYLQACAGSFEAGNIDCCQYLLTSGPSGAGLPWTRDYMYQD